MPFNSINTITIPKKQIKQPFIRFSNPSLVTTTTINSGSVSYRVFEIKGNSTAGSNNIMESATIYNTVNTTIYYLVVGGGGSSGIAATWNATGGGGAGRLMQGNRIVSGNTSEQTINFSVGSGGSTTSINGTESRIVFPNNYSIVAGGGGGSGSNAPSFTTSSEGGNGCGGGANATTSRRGYIYNFGTGFRNGGYGYEMLNADYGFSGGGGGHNRAGDNAFSSHGKGGDPGTVTNTTKGIYEVFTNTTYYSSNELCGGGSGQSVNGSSTIAKGPVSKGQYGAGGSSGYPLASEVAGQRGIIAIAISLNDIPVS